MLLLPFLVLVQKKKNIKNRDLREHFEERGNKIRIIDHAMGDYSKRQLEVVGKKMYIRKSDKR